MGIDLNNFNLENEVNLENARLRIDIVNGLIEKQCDNIFNINSPKGYTLYSTIIDMSCEALEHYFKYILRNSGYEWNDLKRISHDLSELYKLLPIDVKERINNWYLFPNFDEYLTLLDDTELKDNYLLYKHLIDSGKAERDDKLRYNKIRGNIIRKVYKEIDDCIKQKDYTLLITAIKKGLYLYEFEYDGEFTILSMLFDKQDLILEELNKLSSSGRQPINVSSRYPGQKNIKANISFLTSLSTCVDQIVNNQYQQMNDEIHQSYN